jgi:N-sulfoglucosamine sulfohydrolase
VLADLRARLEEWMLSTDDPLLHGPITPPIGARINAQSQRSAEDPTFLIEEAGALAPR